MTIPTTNASRTLTCLLVLVATATLRAETAEPTLALYPPDIHLNGQSDLQQVIAVLIRPDGVTQDVTTQVTLTLADEAVAKLQGSSVRPQADGKTTLQASLGPQSVSASVEVVNAGQAREVSFQQDVMPVFLRTGCNTGSCHGAARGKDGFRLSLFGFDPQGDYFRITREIGARRINLAMPRKQPAD